MKRKKLNRNAMLKKECDKMWSAIIRQNGECEICGSTWRLSAHHLISKGARPKYRYEIMNGIALCSNHHLFDRDMCAHGRNNAATANFLDWLMNHKPEQYVWFEKNREDKTTGFKFDYEQIHRDLQEFMI